MTEVNISFDDLASMWGGAPVGEAGYIDSNIDQLAPKMNSVVLNEDGAKFLLLSDANVGVVSLFWEPEAPLEDRCAIITRADVDRPALSHCLQRIFGSELSIVVYPEEYEIA